MSSVPSPSPAPLPTRTPDFAVLIALDLIRQYDKRRRAVKDVSLKPPKLSSAARLLFIGITSFAWKREDDKRYRCRPGYGALHRLTGLNPNRTIPKARAELVKAGLLKATARIDPDTGKRTSYLYEIIESPEAYQAVVERNASQPKPKRVRGGAFPAKVEELTAARQLQADYAAIYPLLQGGAAYMPHQDDEKGALIVVRAYPTKPKYRGALMAAWADPKALKDSPPPPAHAARQVAHAHIYLPIIDRYWREHGYGPKDDE